MSDYALSTRARRDLDEIAAYIRRDNPSAAYHLLSRFVEKFEFLADMPYGGFRREEFPPRVRALPYKRYIIYYRVFETGIEILRVVHGNRLQDTIRLH